MKRAIIQVSGLVQGIGFRPFVYRLATRRGLSGTVKNLGDAGVRIDVNGEDSDIHQFMLDLEKEKISLAVYSRVDVEWFDYKEYPNFTIDISDMGKKEVKFSLIPPDVATCPTCIEELFNPIDRHYLYPFTCCALCGPRFTTITDLPYDRERTTMFDFPLCGECDREYNDPGDRRFNAQTICCGNNGPKMTLHNPDGSIVGGEDPLVLAAELLEEGNILAVKGIGGIHLAVPVINDDAILKLRSRRRKPSKPFALMSPNIEEIRNYAIVSEIERELLTSLARPIVALRKRKPFSLSDYISPGLHTVGVMLPYSGIHHLLFHYGKASAYIMTSANLPGEPMFVENDVAIMKLKGVADYLLLHNRKIHARCDDSVIRITDGYPTYLRRSRGYVPNPIELPFNTDLKVIAVGSELASTASILKEDKCYLTQHLGDIESPESLDFLREAIEHMLGILRVRQLDLIACDLHPQFLSKIVAEELADKNKAEIIQVQHHHAHLASLMAESGINPEEEIITIDCDGYGYGLEGAAWGGEILLGGYRNFKRIGHLEKQPMPGGDLSVYRYGRMLQGILSSEISRDELRKILVADYLEGYSQGTREVDLVFDQINKKFNTPFTTSAGRLLDAVSCLLGFSFKRTYEGEGAMKLESAAYYENEGLDLRGNIVERDGLQVLQTSAMVRELLENRDKVNPRKLAYSFHRALAEGLADMAINSARGNGLNTVGFTGGVANNELMTRIIREKIESEGLRFLRHTKVPPGDGGLSLGQAVVAVYRTS